MDAEDREIVIGAIRIPRTELTIGTVRSGGPGGQNVNKVATKAVLTFSVSSSPSLSVDQKRRIAKKLASRIGSDGVLRLTSSRFRTRVRNTSDVVERFRTLVEDALRVSPPRRPTAPTRSSKERRLAQKKRRSSIKVGRRGVAPDGEA